MDGAAQVGAAALQAAATPAPLADAELAELAQLEENASPAPWGTSGHDEYGEANIYAVDGQDGYTITANIAKLEGIDMEAEQNDLAFIVAMRNALPGLLARLAAAEAKASLLDSMQETNRVLTERLEKAAKVLEGYEKWEASVLEEDAAWANRAGQPWGTQELYDEWMELQAKRNAVLRPTVKGGQPHA